MKFFPLIFPALFALLTGCATPVTGSQSETNQINKPSSPEPLPPPVGKGGTRAG